jgi:hypothetical protein
MAGVNLLVQEQIEDAESLALMAAAILAELRPLARVAVARNDPYSIERLQRIAKAAEAIRSRAIARRPQTQRKRGANATSFRCPTLEFQNE